MGEGDQCFPLSLYGSNVIEDFVVINSFTKELYLYVYKIVSPPCK